MCLPRVPPGVVAEGLKGVVGVVALKPGVVGVCSDTLPALKGCTDSGNRASASVPGWRSDGSVVLLLGAAAVADGASPSPGDSLELTVVALVVLPDVSIAFAALAIFPRTF